MTDLASAVRDLELPGGSLSVLAVERSSGDVLVAKTPDRTLAPASNTKLVTAGLALEHLGPEWQFTTRLRGPNPDNDVIDGDITLFSDGAPDLEQADLSTLAADVSRYADRIAGDLLVDGTVFSDGEIGPGWTWGDTQQYYGARSSAVGLAQNQVTVTVSMDPAGEPSVSVSPNTAVVDIDETVSIDADASRDDFQIVTDPDSGTITLRGATPPKAIPIEESVPVVRPERHIGLALRAALLDAGVELEGSVRVLDESAAAATTAGTSILGRVDSTPLRELIQRMNVPSDNYIAEQLARRTAYEAMGEGTWDAWERLTQSHFGSLDVDTVRIRDGSGLSRYNLIPARGLVAHLRWVDEHPWSGTFFDSLPTPGNGTLASRLDGVPVAAKTGTITGTSALSGVVERDAVPDVLFSVLHGGLTRAGSDTAREKQDTFVRRLVDRE